MSKLTLSSLASLQSGSAVTALNNNFAAIITAMENTLSRDGTSPNFMGDNLDMNGYRISNLVPAVSDTEPVRLKEFVDGMADLETIVSGYATTTLGYLNSTLTIYDEFDDRYLGAKPSDPSTDNDGNALLTGALYFNTVSNTMRVWTGLVWSGVISTSAGFALDDLGDVIISSAATGDILRFNGTFWVDYPDSNYAASSHTHPSSQITDFTEAAQDAVGGMVDSTLVYADATPALGRAAITGHITIAAGSNSAALGSFTAAQLDSAVSDANVSYTTHTHVLTAGATDVTITAANLNTLDDGVDTTLHFHASDRARANHTGTQVLTTISDVTITSTNLNILDDGADTTLHFHASDRSRANHTGTQILTTISDVTITSTNLNTLDDGVNTTLHFHDSDRSRTNHTGTQLASTISDFTEAAQDAVGGMVDTTIVYTDGTPLLSRAALTGAITASAGSNATSLGSFTIAQLNTAVSDADVQAQDALLDSVAALVDPNADRMLFWDDSAGGFAWLAPGTNLTITGTTMNASGGGGGGVTGYTVEVDFGSTPAVSKIFNIALIGALTTNKVICSISLDMPTGVDEDEIEADPLVVSGRIAVDDNVRLAVASINGSAITGKRNVNLILV